MLSKLRTKLNQTVEQIDDERQGDGCKGSKDTDVSAEVIHRVYDCPSDTAVEFYIIKGGGHAWPGSAFSKSIASVVGYTTMDINASELIRMLPAVPAARLTMPSPSSPGSRSTRRSMRWRPRPSSPAEEVADEEPHLGVGA